MGFFSKIKETLVGKSAKQNDKYVAGLDKSNSSFSSKINELAARYREIDDDYFEELENILIMSDVGVNMVMTIVDEIKKKAQKLGMTFYWYSPTPYCIYNPISSGLGNKSCAAFDSLISVAPNGDVLPCSSWDESMGNLLKQDFETIWFSARGDYFRNKHFAPPECSGCQAFIPCQGACPLYWKVKSSTVLNSWKKEVKK